MSMNGDPTQGYGFMKDFGEKGFVSTDKILDAIRFKEKQREVIDLICLIAAFIGMVIAGIGIYLLFGIGVTLITLGVVVTSAAVYISLKNNKS